MTSQRDSFPSLVKDVLAKRAGQHCSNPGCRIATSGPHEDPEKTINLGVAAHITAAAPGAQDTTLVCPPRSARGLPMEFGCVRRVQSWSTAIPSDSQKSS